MTKDTFQEKFSENPRRDDLTLLAPKQDDPTEQVQGCLRYGLRKRQLAV